MKRIKNLVLLFGMILSAFVFAPANVNAEEFNPEIIGTLSKAGDSVKVKDAYGYSPKYIKYVSSTDEIMYVYTDAESEDPMIRVYDKNGNLVDRYDNIGRENKVLNDNLNNSEIFIKLKKGEVYYFCTFLYDADNMIDYNVNLVKAPYEPDISVVAWDMESDPQESYHIFGSFEGLNYDAKKHILTMENANIPYYIDIKSNTKNILSDGLVEINVLGENTITLDYHCFIASDVSLLFTGNGTLNFKTKTEDYYPYNIVYVGNKNQTTVLRMDGPTIKTGVWANQSVFETKKFVMDSGKIIYSGESNLNIIFSDFICINGGEINTLDGKSWEKNFSSCYFEMNGGIIRTSMTSHKGGKYENKMGVSYRTAIYGSEYVRINGGTIFVNYLEPKVDSGYEVGSISTEYMIESNHEVSINSGNVLVVATDDVQKALGDKLVGIIKNTGGYEPDKTIKFISDEANILMGETLDISKIKCSLEYDKCKYDGKEKKPAVTVNGLVEGTDYTVTYSNNVNPGTAKVTITGKGDFTGKKELNFVIEKAANSSSTTYASKVGTTIKDKKYIYKVTKAGSKDGKAGEVKVVGLNKKSLKKIKIVAKVKIKGVTYKVTSIGAKAFKGNKKITKVTIGKNVKTIGANAFANCKKLKKVTINTKKLKKIGKKAFFKKKGKKITFKVPKAKKKAYKKLLKKAKTNKYVVK